MFEKSSSFNSSFRKGCQEDSVPELLLALVSMILDGPNIKDQISTTQAALTIAQLLIKILMLCITKEKVRQ